MEGWIDVCAADLIEGELRGLEVRERLVLLVRHKGRITAMGDSCNHAGCLLSGGTLEGNTVVCPCHEVGFDLDTGKNVTSPGICDDQPAFKVELEDGELVVVGDVPLD